MTFPDVVSREAWLERRIALLAKEKAFTKARDSLAAERRALPRVAVTADYRFESERGLATLGDLFEGHSQLVVYHFMFGPDWKQGCRSCSFWADTFANVGPHLAARDVALCAVSRAPLAILQKFKERLGWTFPWVSSARSTFNFDFGVSFHPDDAKSGAARYNYATRSAPGAEAPGVSVFMRVATGSVFHTYSTYGRGLDQLNSAYQILDLVPKGRDEAAFDWPMQWVRFRDEYRMPGP